jgi:Pyridoxamine 5'-phosphate oxidase
VRSAGPTMSERDEALRSYQAALVDPSPANLDALEAALDANVDVVGVVGPGHGIDEVRHSLANPRRPGFLASATWTPTARAADGVVVDVVLPGGGPVDRLTLEVSFVGDRIARVHQLVTMAPPPEATPLALGAELRATVDGALAAGLPLVLAYVGADDGPRLSLRGSTSAYSDTQLAIWVRDPTGGLLGAIEEHPRVALLYRDPAAGISYQFAGRAKVDDRPEVRDAVYASSPGIERNLDAGRRGRAVIVDLDRVEGTGPAGRIRMVATGS